MSDGIVNERKRGEIKEVRLDFLDQRPRNVPVKSVAAETGNEQGNGRDEMDQGRARDSKNPVLRPEFRHVGLLCLIAASADVVDHELPRLLGSAEEGAQVGEQVREEIVEAIVGLARRISPAGSLPRV